MSACLKCLIFACAFLVLVGSAPVKAGPQGFLEGNLKIYSPKEVELAGETPSKTAHNYVEYPLIILNGDTRKQVAQVTADENGRYRVALPPGDYVLDVQDRMRRHVRAAARPFKVVTNQTVHVDMNLDTGVR
ncbi:MAG: hypothetical protein ACM3KL_06605 [Alphaproteobacteria bacterium]